MGSAGQFDRDGALGGGDAAELRALPAGGAYAVQDYQVALRDDVLFGPALVGLHPEGEGDAPAALHRGLTVLT